MAMFQAVVFKLNEKKYGVDIGYVNSIEKEQKVIQVPNSSTSIKGIVNLRGEVIPVVDLKTKFGLNYADKEITEMIIVNHGETKLGLEVDIVNEIHNIDADDIVEMPIIAKGDGVEYFERVAKDKEDLIIMVNPDKLLSEAEADSVATVVEVTSAE